MVLPVRQIPNGDGSGQPCVCLFSALYAPSVGGVEGYTEHLAHALACMGCRVIVVAMNTHGREGYVHEPATHGAYATHARTEHSISQSVQPETLENRSSEAAGIASVPTQAELVTETAEKQTSPLKAPSPKPEPAITDGDTPLVEVVRLPCRPLLGGRYPVPRRNAEFRALWKWLESQHINYVVVNTRFYLLSEIGVEFAQAKGIVPVVIEHGSAHLTMGNPVLDQAVQAVEHGLTKRLAPYPTAFYGVSKRACDWLGHFGIAASGVLPNAIDADAFTASATEGERFDLPPETFAIAFVGRLVPEKGIGNLVKAVGLMEADRPVVLLVAGDGPLRNDLTREAEPGKGKAPLNRVILLGSLSKPQVAALLAQADVLCLPSRSEGFATVLLEASAMGTPCIATPVGGTDELFPTAGFGVVIPDAEPQTIAGALEAAAADPETWQAMGRHAAERVRSHFTWQTTAESLLTACRQINQR